MLGTIRLTVRNTDFELQTVKWRESGETSEFYFPTISPCQYLAQYMFQRICFIIPAREARDESQTVGLSHLVV